MPGRIIKNHRIRFAILIFAGYWLLSIFVRPIQMAQVLSLVLIFVAAGVLRKYAAQVWDAVLIDDRGPISQLAQGIWLAFFGLLVGLVWAILSRVLPNADWMMRTPVVGFYLLCYIVAGSLHMTARRGSDGRVQDRDLWDVMISYGLGLSISIILMMLQLGGVLRDP